MAAGDQTDLFMSFEDAEAFVCPSDHLNIIFGRRGGLLFLVLYLKLLLFLFS